MSNKTCLGILGNLTPQNNIISHYQENFFRNLSKEGKKLGIEVYLFSPLDNKNNDNLTGYIFENNRWLKVNIRDLDVIYDRGFFQKSSKEDRLYVNNFREQLKSYPWINSINVSLNLMDKYNFSKIMHKNGIPHPITVNENEISLLEDYNTIFLKPRYGGKGDGIILIEKKDNRYNLYYKKNNLDSCKDISLINIRPSELDKRLNNIKRELLCHNKSYILQNGLDLFKFQNKQTDVRFLGQKNLENKINCIELVSRIGGNLSKNGRAETFDKVIEELSKVTGRSLDSIRNDTLNLGIAAYQAFERELGENAGEIGFDLGYDRGGYPYVIEANSKPDILSIVLAKEYKGTNIKIHSKRIILRRIKNLLGYAKHLKN